MLINHDMQDLHAEVAYRRTAMQRAAAGPRRRRRPIRRSARVDAERLGQRPPAEG